MLSSTDLSRERQDEVLRALDIDRIPVHEIMVPRDEVVALHDTNDLYENLHRMRTHPHDRYPLLGNGWDDVRGTLYLPTAFRHLPELDRGPQLSATSLNRLYGPDRICPSVNSLIGFNARSKN